MNEKELLSQLNNLKNIKPDSQWKKKGREILLNQVSSTQEYVKVNWLRVLINMLPQGMTKQLSQPVWAVILIVAVVFSSCIAGLNAARDTKPGDSLYIAKIISEKTQLAITFNEKEKAKLGIEFAGNRAKEIAQVLAEVDSQEKEAKVKVEKLTRNFKKEIKAVRSRLEKINAISKNTGKSNKANSEEENKALEEEVQFFSVILEKNNQGVDISKIENNLNSTTSTKINLEDQEADNNKKESESTASSTESENVTEEAYNDLEKALEEAEKLFDEENYSGTLSKLAEANNIIDDNICEDVCSDSVESEQEYEDKNENTASTTESDAVKEDLTDTASSTEE